MGYRLEIRARAFRELAALPERDRRRVSARIDALADDPRPVGSKKLKEIGKGELHRIRVGDYRVVYRIQDRIVTVTVIKVGHRRDVYRGL